MLHWATFMFSLLMLLYVTSAGLEADYKFFHSSKTKLQAYHLLHVDHFIYGRMLSVQSKQRALALLINHTFLAKGHICFMANVYQFIPVCIKSVFVIYCAVSL